MLDHTGFVGAHRQDHDLLDPVALVRARQAAVAHGGTDRQGQPLAHGATYSRPKNALALRCGDNVAWFSELVAYCVGPTT